MIASQLLSLIRRRGPWLLWLALVLPLAQGVAAAHALSHVAVQAAGTPDDEAGLQPGQCTLCLGAAAVTGGAMASPGWLLQQPVLRPLQPARAGAAQWLAPPTRAYRSRAPPISLS